MWAISHLKYYCSEAVFISYVNTWCPGRAGHHNCVQNEENWDFHMLMLIAKWFNINLLLLVGGLLQAKGK